MWRLSLWIALSGSLCLAQSPAQVPAGLRDFRVTASGAIGQIDGETYRYSIYCMIRKDDPAGMCGDDSFTARFNQSRGLRITAGAKILFDRIDAEFESQSYEPPQLVSTVAGTVLYLPVRIDGTGNFNESEYYLRVGDKWETLEARAWLEEIGRRIPKGLETWKGIWPDLHTMQAQAGLYRPGDANCCPTGGIANIRLAIRNKAFVLDSVTVGPVK